MYIFFNWLFVFLEHFGEISQRRYLMVSFFAQDDSVKSIAKEYMSDGKIIGSEYQSIECLFKKLVDDKSTTHPRIGINRLEQVLHGSESQIINTNLAAQSAK